MTTNWWVWGNLLLGLILALSTYITAADVSSNTAVIEPTSTTISVNVSPALSIMSSGTTLATLTPTSMSTTTTPLISLQKSDVPMASAVTTATPTSTLVPTAASSMSEPVVPTATIMTFETSALSVMLPSAPTASLTQASSSVAAATSVQPSTLLSSTLLSSSSLLSSTTPPETSIPKLEPASSFSSSMMATSSIVPTSTVTIATTSSIASVTPVPQTVFLINEFNFTGIFEGEHKFFVEIKRVGGTDSPALTVVILNWEDSSPTCWNVMTFGSDWTNNLKLKEISLSESPGLGIIVALYSGVKWPTCGDANLILMDPVDVVIVAKVAHVPSNDTRNQFIPDNPSHVLIAERKENDKGQYSVSRCADTPRDPWAFILTSVTPEQPNECTLTKYTKIVKMTFNNSKCDMFSSTNKSRTIGKLVDFMVTKIGEDCACGLSPLLFSYRSFECKAMTVTWSISAASQPQLEFLKSQYDALMERTHCIPTRDNGDKLCLGEPCTSCSHLPTKKDGNIKVTIGVVTGCVLVFFILVIVIIVYIRKKRRGILQFRMTRLDEDDDDLMAAPDMDDFIGGGGQDASFNNPMYSRFK